MDEVCLAYQDFIQKQLKILPVTIRDLSPGSLEFNSWASGVKARYCNHLCNRNLSCGIVYDRAHHPQEELPLNRIKAELERKGIGRSYELALEVFRAEVGRNKWFMSQRRGYVIGWDEAEQDYISNYLSYFVRGFMWNEDDATFRNEIETSKLRRCLALEEKLERATSP